MEWVVKWAAVLQRQTRTIQVDMVNCNKWKEDSDLFAILRTNPKRSIEVCLELGERRR